MASIHLDRKLGNCFIRFRYGGVSFKRSLKISDRREANTIRGRVAEAILRVEQGWLEIPPNADPGIFLLSDGKRNGKPEKPKVRTLRDLFRVYNEELPEGAKEESTLIGEPYPRSCRRGSHHIRVASLRFGTIRTACPKTGRMTRWDTARTGHRAGLEQSSLAWLRLSPEIAGISANGKRKFPTGHLGASGNLVNRKSSDSSQIG